MPQDKMGTKLKNLTHKRHYIAEDVRDWAASFSGAHPMACAARCARAHSNAIRTA